MILSMTGFGKQVVQFSGKKITIELKSLNSKNLDINARMPSIYREKELKIRKLIADNLKRGKVDFNLYLEITGEETASVINGALVRSYMSQLGTLANTTDDELLKMAVRLPDVITTQREEPDESEFKIIEEALGKALDAIKNFRQEEGGVLENDFSKRVKNISALLQEVEDLDPDRKELIQVRLRKALNELKTEVDENRFEQELVYYLEKFDVTEEKVRLKTHLDYFTNCLSSDDSNGKKLAFISQEMGREINTLGSKANHAPMQKIVVQMKDELEKIKEQLLNVL